MKILISIFFILKLSLPSLEAQGKDTLLLLPGDKKILTRSISGYTGHYDIFRVKGDTETVFGSLDDNFTVLPVSSGNQNGLRVCRIQFGVNSILDSGLCNLQGLAPIHHRSVQTAKTLNLNFRADSITGDIFFPDSNKTINIHYKSPQPLFDSYYEDIIAKTVQLKKELVFKFPEYIYERGGIVWSVGTVLGIDSAALKGKNAPVVWTVLFQELNNINETVRTTTYKIEGKTGEILSREYLTKNGRILMRKRDL